MMKKPLLLALAALLLSSCDKYPCDDLSGHEKIACTQCEETQKSTYLRVTDVRTMDNLPDGVNINVDSLRVADNWDKVFELSTPYFVTLERACQAQIDNTGDWQEKEYYMVIAGTTGKDRDTRPKKGDLYESSNLYSYYAWLRNGNLLERHF